MGKEAYTITLMNGSKIKALFGEATARQKHKCYTIATSARGSYLDEDEVIARDEHLNEQPLALNSGNRTWCLYRQDDHDQILSTCKTIDRSLILSEMGNTREIRGYCVTSVHTPLLYRGHGLASHMLNNVAQWLDGPGEAAISMLYSGKPEFYEKVGWTALYNTETILSCISWLQNVLGSYADLEIRCLSDADIPDLCAQDIEETRASSQQIVAGDDEALLTILPTEDLVRYQHALSDYTGDRWHSEAPEKRGAAYKDQAWSYWQHDFRGRCLYIQRAHHGTQDEEVKPEIMAALSLAAFREANEWNFTSVATWDISPHVRGALDTLAQASYFNTSVCDKHRAQRISIRWWNGEKRAGNVAMSNEAYAWISRS